MKASLGLAVLDMVGTTVKDAGEAPSAFRIALNEFGVAITDDHLREVRGAAKRAAIRTLLGPGKQKLADAAYARFKDLLAERIRARAAPVEGVDRVFAFLREHRMAIALNTGFDRAITNTLMEALGWPGVLFAAVVCADDVENGRPAPDMIFAAMQAAGVSDPTHVVNVGDTTLDLEAGAAAGVRLNVGVCTGAHGRKRLAQVPHTHLIETIEELPWLLQYTLVN